MMSQSYKIISSEKGSALVLGIFILAILLAISGLAIDSGRFYQAKLQLQKAADAGALAGIGSAALDSENFLKEETVEKRKEFIEKKAQEVTRKNLELAGFDMSSENLDVRPNYDPGTRTLRVEADSSKKAILSLAVPQFLFDTKKVRELVTLSVHAEVQRKTANISLVIDISDSMNCPSLGNCACNTSNRTEGVTCEDEAVALGVEQKINDLKIAMKDFINHFDEAEDRINLVTFSLLADLKVPLKAGAAPGFTKTDFDIIDSISGSGATNHSDGLMTAYDNFRNEGMVNRKGEEITYVLFSDGSPTATRMLLSSPKLSMQNTPESTLGTHDYYHHSLVWKYETTDESLFGPSMFFRFHPDISRDYSAVIAPPGYTPECHHPTIPIGETTSTHNELQFNNIFDDCVDNLGFHMPGDPSKIYGNNYNLTGGKPYRQHWQEQYYNTTIQLSDFLRENNSMVYAIGLGDASNIDEDIRNKDPFQKIDSSLNRKDFLMSRVSSDYIQAKIESSRTYDGVHPEFNYNGYQEFDQILDSANPLLGRYFSTPKSEELTGIFRSIAQKVLLRLTK